MSIITSTHDWIAGDTAWIADGIAETWDLDHVTVSVLDDTVDAIVVVDVDGLPYAITRVLRPGRISVTAIESEVAWMTALGADDVVRVPRVLTTRTGTAVGVLDGPRNTRWSAVSIRYEPLIAAPPAPGSGRATLAALGGLAGALHEHARRWQPPAWFRRPSLEVLDLAGPTSGIDWEALPLSSSAQNLLGTAQEEALDRVSWAAEPSGLVHGDLRDAVVIGEEPLLRSFDCRWTWWEQDLAGSMSGLEDKISAPSLAKAWLEAYEGELDLRLAGALVMLRRLALLSHDPALAEGTLDVATRYLGSPTWLFD
ncbi:phosphotransferase [Actinotalea sp. M2MS4P-6]|uniref:phosphotransferase enzyme family protein n=1 Tax=Actinotalea sp. M2MS4P-6 TaxID=2983762 RepID=UPI0021E484B4|nr:phosphotransferase [Actinotalea sp. M2MS4P-6]MCV2392717.1 phosphotransferase [Actinotalea sp. M2MS4P-6]